MPKFTMLCGISGSGKSTIAKQLKTDNTMILSSDEIRKELWGSENDQQHPEKVFEIMRSRTIDALRNGFDVIYDATNLSSKRRAGFLNELNHAVHDLRTELHLVLAPLEQCIANQELRDRQVPDYVVHKHAVSFTMPSLEEKWTEPVQIHNPYYRDGYLQELIDATNGVSQLGPWHQETVDKHVEMVTRYAKSHGFSDMVCEVATIHDIGKPMTRSVESMEESADGAVHTHFYGHANLGAYLYLCASCKTGPLTHEDWYKASLIEHHMDLSSKNGISKEKIIAKVGETMYNDIKDMREADENGAVRESELRTMSVLKFMNAFEDWEERISQPPYNVTVRHDGDYVLLKYQQFNSDISIRLVQESRGSIFKKSADGEWKYVCRPFDKFFNYGEATADEIDWSTARVLAKVDGCFDGFVCVTLDDGSSVPFYTLPEKMQHGDVYVRSRNMKTGAIENKKITGISIKAGGQQGEWNVLCFGDISIKCTINHVFYVVNGKELIEKTAYDLTRDDKVVLYQGDMIKHVHLTQKIGIFASPLKYDIEVEDNHNYFANGVLVHNSLMKMYYDDGWHLATNGTIDAFKTPVADLGYSFGDVFNRALGYDFKILGGLLDPQYTYMFEMTAPDTQVVIPYQDGVWYLSRRHTESGKEEFDRPILTGVQHPKEYFVANFEDVLEAASKMGKDEEGFVVNDAQSHRVKVKSPEYLIAAHLANNKMVSNRNLVEYMKEGRLDDFLAYCPQYADRVNDLLGRFAAQCTYLNSEWDRVKGSLYMSGRDFAALVGKTDAADYLFKKKKTPELTSEEYLLGLYTPSLMRALGFQPEKESIEQNAPDVDER